MKEIKFFVCFCIALHIHVLKDLNSFELNIKFSYDLIIQALVKP